MERSLIDNILPVFTCILCGRREFRPISICFDCFGDLPAIHDACIVCSKPMLSRDICIDCSSKRPVLDKIISAFQYQYPVDILIKNIKYKQRLGSINTLANALSNKIADEGFCLPEVLLPVPLYRDRLYKRGFNQAVEICKILRRNLGIESNLNLLKRSRSTPPMYDLSPSQRRQNVRGAFRVCRPIEYKSVAIVDDIVTSAATASELSRVLKLNGVERVELWTLARA